ncbi:50S ribosomal protein L10 [Candidatus Berkelbacteria bacterium]|nr:50S ribosomal protein L10 [Candidatus Berkelbacteria bacterium]
MPLIRSQKEALVEQLLNELKDSRVSIIVAYNRLNMKSNDKLRSSAFNEGGKIKMISNNLLSIILKKLDRKLEIPQKTLAIAYGFNDEVTAAKTLVEFAKETESLEVIGGWIDGAFFDASQVKTLSSLPSKETLQAQLVGRLNGLIGSLAYSLNYPIQKFAFVVEALKSAERVSAEPKVEEVKAVAPVVEESSTPKEETNEPEATEEVAESTEVKEEEK